LATVRLGSGGTDAVAEATGLTPCAQSRPRGPGGGGGTTRFSGFALTPNVRSASAPRTFLKQGLRLTDRSGIICPAQAFWEGGNHDGVSSRQMSLLCRSTHRCVLWKLGGDHLYLHHD